MDKSLISIKSEAIRSVCCQPESLSAFGVGVDVDLKPIHEIVWHVLSDDGDLPACKLFAADIISMAAHDSQGKESYASLQVVLLQVNS
eukprot:6103473-Amphidinium_carterae.1